jgi:hypothetical protein
MVYAKLFVRATGQKILITIHFIQDATILVIIMISRILSKILKLPKYYFFQNQLFYQLILLKH